MSLEHNVAKGVARASYALLVDITSGNVTLSVSAQGSSFIDIPNATWSSSTVVLVDLPTCEVKATITGTAQVELLKIDYKL
jgi:hypothetical protein